MKQVFLLLLLTLSVVVYGAKEYKFVVMETNQGTIKIKLYQDTPKHSENFLKLIKEHHYDGLLFHRVIQDFMIQGGASDSRNSPKSKKVGVRKFRYEIDAEILPVHFHKKGALAGARQGDDQNPEKKSSGEQFYIVQGKTYTDQELDQIEMSRYKTAVQKIGSGLYRPHREEHSRYMNSGQKEKADSLINAIGNEMKARMADYKDHLFSPEARNVYKTIGGTPFLDGEYTVFGEVVEGLDIVDKIAGVKTGEADRPVENVVILSVKLKNK